MQPDILVLDEPTSGLDPKGRDALLDLFTAIHNELNSTVIIITHDMNIVYKYASRVLVMKEGSLVFDGKPLDLFTKEDLVSWNLDLPEILQISKQLEEKLQITIDAYPRTIDDLFEIVKGALS